MSDRPKRKDAKAISGVILETTEALFSRYGVENVSMHQVAKAAGVGQGTLYRRYANKGDLCLDLMRENVHALQEETVRYLEESGKLPVKKRIQTIFTRHISFMEDHIRLFEAIHTYTTCQKTKKPFYEAQPYIFIHGTIRSLLEEAVETKEARSVNADFTAHSLIASINPKVYLFLRQKNGYSSEEIAENFNRSLLEPLFIG